MSTKVKGLLKGLRYISQMFENEKEPEMQIGFPTDVKHVAHIGWDGPSVSSPSWMNEFKSSPEIVSAPLTSNGVAKGISADEDINRTEDAKPPSSKEKQRRRRSSSGGTLSLGSPARNPSDASNHSRRHHSSGGSIISGNQESSGSARSSRRHQNLSGQESPSKDGPGIPKQSRRRKSKGSSGGGSNRSRSKGQASLTDVDPFSESGPVSGTKHEVTNGTLLCPISVLEVFEEENECDEISKELCDL